VFGIAIVMTKILLLSGILLLSSIAANWNSTAQPGILDPSIHQSSHQISKTLSTAEWMGPLAPVALSPFFGLAILSGIAAYGPEWLQQRSALFDASGSLNNPWLFWSMATLAVFTSLPRLSKVSKPIALAAEKLETYSAVIILIVLRLSSASDVPTLEGNMPTVAVAGIATIPYDILMAGVAALNVIVINALKIFFEFLVWLTPFPFIDACFEASNKTLCAALTGLYCFSPFLATIVNLAMFAIAGLAFMKISRLLRYYRELVVGPILSLLFPKWFGADPNVLVGFLAEPWNSLPKLARVEIETDSQGHQHLIVRGRSLWRRSQATFSNYTMTNESGLIIQRLSLQSDDGLVILVYHRRLGKHERPIFLPEPKQIVQFE
jgi:hypothetical protein